MGNIAKKRGLQIRLVMKVQRISDLQGRFSLFSPK